MLSSCLTAISTKRYPSAAPDAARRQVISSHLRPALNRVLASQPAAPALAVRSAMPPPPPPTGDGDSGADSSDSDADEVARQWEANMSALSKAAIDTPHSAAERRGRDEGASSSTGTGTRTGTGTGAGAGGGAGSSALGGGGGAKPPARRGGDAVPVGSARAPPIAAAAPRESPPQGRSPFSLPPRPAGGRVPGSFGARANKDLAFGGPANRSAWRDMQQGYQIKDVVTDEDAENMTFEPRINSVRMPCAAFAWRNACGAHSSNNVCHLNRNFSSPVWTWTLPRAKAKPRNVASCGSCSCDRLPGRMRKPGWPPSPRPFH